LKTGNPAPEFVFVTKKGRLESAENLRYGLEKCLEKAKLRRIRIHDLRHTYATIRLLRGHNIGDVSYQLGHSSIKITYDTYVVIGFRGSSNQKLMSLTRCTQMHPICTLNLMSFNIDRNYKRLQDFWEKFPFY